MFENIEIYSETSRFDQRMLTCSGTTASRLDEEFSDSWKQEDADVTFVGPDGLMFAVETKVDSTRKNDALIWWSALQNKAWSDPTRFWVYISGKQNLPNRSAIVLSCSSVSESARDLGHYESLASAYVNTGRTFAPAKLEAIPPIIKTAYVLLSELPAPQITRDAIRAILHEFAEVLTKHKTAEWPPLRLVTLEDFSYLLEWTFLDRRLGFSFESDPKDSGWYYVYSHNSSERCESGTMDQLELSRLIGMMLRS
jgi:hypothetical protein